MGYTEPSPIQMAAIPLGLQFRDVIGVAETVRLPSTAPSPEALTSSYSRTPSLAVQNVICHRKTLSRPSIGSRMRFSSASSYDNCMVACFEKLPTRPTFFVCGDWSANVVISTESDFCLKAGNGGTHGRYTLLGVLSTGLRKDSSFCAAYADVHLGTACHDGGGRSGGPLCCHHGPHPRTCAAGAFLLLICQTLDSQCLSAATKPSQSLVDSSSVCL